MKPTYPTLRVANGEDPLRIVEVMLPRDRVGAEFFYHPNQRITGKEYEPQENLSKINASWLEKWHRENPEYEFRSVYHRPHSGLSPNRFGERPAIAMPSTDQSIAQGHHEINADLVHVPTRTKVGDDMLISLANWPELPRGKGVTTAHIWSFYRHNKPEPGEPDPHKHIMTKALDSWLNHVKEHGVRHGFIQGDASKGYWLKNITRHPDMMWGGVEYDALRQRTRYPQHMYVDDDTSTRTPDMRRLATLKSHPDLFAGWPGTRVRAKAVGEDVDAYVMKWNQNHPRPEGPFGPIPTHVMRFENGTPRKLDGHLNKACYHNTYQTSRRNKKMRMVIGFVVPESEASVYEKGGPGTPMMFTHAFNLNERGEVHDTTLGNTRERLRYYGRVVPPEVAQTFKSGEDLANWFGRHFQHGHGRGPDSLYLGQRSVANGR